MSKPKFDVGDTVMLKSGGPKMTIKSISETTYLEDIQYCCCWFNKEEESYSVKESIFRGLTLTASLS